MKPPVKMRDPIPGDRGYLRSTWVDCYREHAVDSTIRSIPGREWRARWGRVAERLLESSRVRVACDPQDPSTIIGYIVWEPATAQDPVRLHWVHVRRELQGFGMLAVLLEEAGLSRADGATPVHFGTRTVRWDRIAKPACWKYLPWLTLGV